jgi:D-lactate dehydrogenase
MKIVFFDSDQMLLDYFKDKKFADANVQFTAVTADDAPAEYLDADVISVFVNSVLDVATLSKFPNLKLVVARSTGINHIDIEHCRAHNIKVASANGYGEFAVSEFAIGLLLCLMRKILIANQDMRSGKIEMEKYIGRDIHGKTIGVFGTGIIGSRFARLAAAFGARVIAYDRGRNPELSGIVEYVELDALYKESDIIALNIPANAANYHIINADAIAKMKPGVILLNVARGELINSRALFDALVSGHVGGVAQDVLELESAMNSSVGIDALSRDQMEIVMHNEKMMHMENVIFTPHTAFNSAEAARRILDMTYDNIMDFLK